MKEVLIIGGGASGLVSAIYASKDGNKVTILEKNNQLGKKILITGNGKCNYWNNDISLDHYHTQNKEYLSKIITNKNQQDILSLFERLGIIPKIKDGYYYPYSGQATSIQTALIKECNILNVNIITNCEVTNIKKENSKFKILTTKGEYISDKIIISTGSYAYPKTGSTGDGYKFLQILGHTIIPPLPALVQLVAKESYLKEWQGIRSEVSVTLIENNKEIKKEIGEIQLTDYGLSGICIFNISSFVSKGLNNHKKEQIKINFLDPFNINNINETIELINKRNKIMKNRTISDLLDGLLNYKLINLFLKLSKIKKEDKWNNITIEQKQKLSNYLTNFIIEIKETKSFDTSQTCTGGVPLSEINPSTMASLKCNNLYITGELLDTDGECGGYNLAFAWITGMLAGKGVNND